MIEITTGLNDYRLAGVVNFLAVGTTNNATANIYSGTRPALGGTPTGDLLVSVVLVEPLGSISAGVLAITPTEEAMIAASGVATWAQIVNGDGAVGWHCDVSDLAGDGELKIPSTTLYAGGYTRIVSGALG